MDELEWVQVTLRLNGVEWDRLVAEYKRSREGKPAISVEHFIAELLDEILDMREQSPGAEDYVSGLEVWPRALETPTDS